MPLPGWTVIWSAWLVALGAGLVPVEVMVRASPFASAVARVRVTVAPLAEAFVTVSALAVPPEGVTVTEYPAPPSRCSQRRSSRSQRWPRP